MSVTVPPRSSPDRFLRVGICEAVISLWICVGLCISTSEATVSHQYIECYKDNWDQRAMEFLYRNNIVNNTPQSCSEACAEGNYSFAGLQYGDNCFCGDSYDKYGVSTACNMSCSGDMKTICGGFFANSVYSVCPVGSYGKSCTGVCHCLNNERCLFRNGSCPSSQCEDGWTGTSCNIRDRDECHENICDNSTTDCHNTPGSYNCSCKTGFSHFDGRSCSDIDECRSNRTNACDRQSTTCDNTFGSYGCSCRSGFDTYNYRSRACNDTDECSSSGTNGCDRASTTCMNTIGSYGCSCRSGFDPYAYIYDSRACKDINECSMNVCDLNTMICTNSYGSYSCSCKSGFNTHNATSCIDVDECQQNKCEKSTTYCRNTPGSYNCICKTGFLNFNGSACYDTGECRSIHTNACDRESTTCTNRIGSYTCSCRSGFDTYDYYYRACTDIDECQQNRCDNSSTDCRNTPGSYSCSCKKGFLGFNSHSCSDIDECHQNICNNSTTDCRNTPGSYNCSCKKGFLDFNGHSCSDADECNMNVCDNDTTTCNNTIGSYSCSCKSGFQAHNTTTCRPIGVEANVGTVVGTVVGSLLAVAVVVIIAFAFLLFYRRRNGTPSGCCKSQAALNPLHENISIDALQQESCYGNSSPVTLKELPTVIQHKLSTQGVLDKEFKLVPMETKDPSTVGKAQDLKKKNRFRNILPYDKNRVLLSQIGGVAFSDYINASVIKGYRDRDKLIATQGPVSETINDFWRMICEKDVCVIAMITDLKENNKTKCTKYWPDIGKLLSCNGITVRTTSEYLWNGYTSRHFQVTKDYKCWEVTHWHFLSYPDHGVPEDVAKFMTFLKKVCSSKLPGKYTVVHCSAGAGRTGTFIAIDYLIQQGNDSGRVDILGCLQSLRSQRPQMIQNLTQYEFVHTALLFEYTVGDTSISCSSFGKKIAALLKKDINTGRSKLEAQLQNLEDRKDHKSEGGKIHVSSKSIDKRKLAEMNVTMIQGWKGTDAFITLGFPRSSAVDVFYSLIKEFNCTAVVFLDGELGTVEPLFPTRGKPILLRSSNILCTNSSKEAYGMCYKISEIKVSNDTYANVAVYANSGEMSAKMEITVLHVTCLANTERLEFSVLNSVYNCIKKLNVGRTQGPAVVISRTGDATSAFCVAALNAFDMIRDVKEVDIFQIVQNIQKSRPQFSFSPSSYNELYYVVGKYIDSN